MAPWSLQRSFRWLFLQQLDLCRFGNSHYSQTAPTPIKYCRLKIISHGLAMFGHSTTILCCLFPAYKKWTTNKNKHWNKTLKTQQTGTSNYKYTCARSLAAIRMWHLRFIAAKAAPPQPCPHELELMSVMHVNGFDLTVLISPLACTKTHHYN